MAARSRRAACIRPCPAWSGSNGSRPACPAPPAAPSCRAASVAAITDGTGQNAPTLVAYTYLGTGTIIGQSHPQVSGGLDLTYGNKTNGYSGLDRYGRVVDEIWQTVGENPTVLDEYAYGYDAAGNRLWKENVVAHERPTPVNLDELYLYDDLYRLLAADRGRLALDGQGNASLETGSQTLSQDWALDSLGNWSGFDDNGASQDRTVNSANEITNITGSSVTPTYDAAGNMISAPKPGDESTRNHYLYDAWNRLVAVCADDSQNPGQPGAIIASYTYDGLNQRVTKTLADGTATDYFYNQQWQTLEEQRRDGVGNLVSTDQYAWDISYIDSPAVSFHTAAGSGTTATYYTTDANHNVTATIDPTDGDVVERRVYSPYGLATVYQPDWTSPAAPDSDGFFYCGYQFDYESSLYVPRNREYHPTLGQFTVRDPLGFAAGDTNLYRYVANNPVRYLDPSGKVLYISSIASKKMRYSLDNYRITGWDEEPDPADDNYCMFSGKTRFVSNPDLKVEIVARMISSPRKFRIGGNPHDLQSSLDALGRHIFDRKKLVRAARDFNNLNIRFARSEKDVKANKDFWVLEPTQQEVEEGVTMDTTELKLAPWEWKGKKPTAQEILERTLLAIDDLWNPEHSKLYALTCRQATNMVISSALQQGKLRSDETSNIFTDWVPGDKGFVENLDWIQQKDKPFAQQGENIIYLGNGEYWGHIPFKDNDHPNPQERVRSLYGWVAYVNQWGTADVTSTRDYPGAGLI